MASAQSETSVCNSFTVEVYELNVVFHVPHCHVHSLRQRRGQDGETYCMAEKLHETMGDLRTNS